jgi:hypothetical protein
MMKPVCLNSTENFPIFQQCSTYTTVFSRRLVGAVFVQPPFSITFQINDTVFFPWQVECRYYSLILSAPSSVDAPTTLHNGILSIISWFKRGLVFHIKN